MKQPKTACLVMAAGRGSRMKGYAGNKALLPLQPEGRPSEGRHPIIHEILFNLPEGPCAIVVNHREEDVRRATQRFGVTYCRQPELNGTGGALLAARAFIHSTPFDVLLITMGDVPLVTRPTYQALVEGLSRCGFMVLGFRPVDRRRYGLVEMQGERVIRITEWAYWNKYPPEKKNALRICNAGIYAVRKDILLRFLPILEARPHIVDKEFDGMMRPVKEYFMTDLVEYLNAEGVAVGCHVVQDEIEVMGVDDPEALQRAQEAFLAGGGQRLGRGSQ